MSRSSRTRAFAALRPSEREMLAPFEHVSFVSLDDDLMAKLLEIDPDVGRRRKSLNGRRLFMRRQGRSAQLFIREDVDAVALRLMTDMQVMPNPNKGIGHEPVEW